MLNLVTPSPSSTQRQQPWTPFHSFFAAAMAEQKAVALWRLPGMAPVHGVVDLSHANKLTSIDFRRRRAGFVFAPFVPGRSQPMLRIDADALIAGDGLTFSSQGSTEVRRQAQQQFAAAFARYTAEPPLAAPYWYTTGRAAGHVAQEQDYTALVCRAVHFIRDTGIAKVVVSRTVEQALPESFDPVGAFLELSVRHSHAFVSLVSVPGVGTWLGASPEILLTLDDHRLTTMALAGTQRRPEDRPLSDVTWGAKESIEQEMVSQYVREFFAQAGVPNVIERGPQTVAAANVVHLQTLFEISLSEEERLALANRVLDELHPTSAVCGMPKHKALAFILANEGYNRNFYSGFLGPVHLDGCSSLFVNLRCMQLHAASASLYVGGGITADSDPAAEWRETEMKAETMLSVLRPTR